MSNTDEASDKEDKILKWKNSRKETLINEVETACRFNDPSDPEVNLLVGNAVSRLVDIIVDTEMQLVSLRNSLVLVIEANQMLGKQVEALAQRVLGQQKRGN